MNRNVFRVVAWVGVGISLLSRVLFPTALNPLLLFVGAPLVLIGLIGLFIYWKK